MMRFTAAAALFAASLSFDANALTIEPLTGTTPQETCFSCVFPNEIGVIARDDAGQPVAGVPVTFTSQAPTLALVSREDLCCAPLTSLTIATGADGIARATAITRHQPSSTGVVRAAAAGAADVDFTLSSTAQRAMYIVPLDPYHYQYAQIGTPFPAQWSYVVVDAAGLPVPGTIVNFYGGNFGGVQATAAFNGLENALAVADATGMVVSPVAHAASIGDEGGVGAITASIKAPVAGEAAPWAASFYVVTNHPITSHFAAIVGNPPDSVQLNSVAAGSYAVRVLDALGNPAVGMPVHFVTDHFAEEPRCISFAGEGSGEEVAYTDANGVATPSVLYGDIAGSCTLRIWVAGIPQAIERPVYVFNGEEVVIKAKHGLVKTRTGRDFRVTLEFFHNGRPVQPGAIEWVEVKPYHPSFPAGIDGYPLYTFSNNAAKIEMKANQWPGLYDLEIAYTVENRKRVHVLQAP